MRPNIRPPRGAARRGAAAVELAVLLPFLVLLGLIATDWARLLYVTITLEECARNGALFASDPVSQKYSPYYSAANTYDQNVTAAALTGGSGLATEPTITSATSTDSAGNATVTVTATYTFNTIASVPFTPGTQTLTRRVQMRITPS